MKNTDKISDKEITAEISDEKVSPLFKRTYSGSEKDILTMTDKRIFYPIIEKSEMAIFHIKDELSDDEKKLLLENLQYMYFFIFYFTQFIRNSGKVNSEIIEDNDNIINKYLSKKYPIYKSFPSISKKLYSKYNSLTRSFINDFLKLPNEIYEENKKPNLSDPTIPLFIEKYTRHKDEINQVLEEDAEKLESIIKNVSNNDLLYLTYYGHKLNPPPIYSTTIPNLSKANKDEKYKILLDVPPPKMPPPIGIRVAAKIRASASTIKRKFGFAGKKTRGKKKKSKDKKKKQKKTTQKKPLTKKD